MQDIKYTIGNKQIPSRIIYISNDARIAAEMVDDLFNYVNDQPIIKSGYVSLIWRQIYKHIDMIKGWVNNNNVSILLDKFEKRLAERRK